MQQHLCAVKDASSTMQVLSTARCRTPHCSVLRPTAAEALVHKQLQPKQARASKRS